MVPGRHIRPALALAVAAALALSACGGAHGAEPGTTPRQKPVAPVVTQQIANGPLAGEIRGAAAERAAVPILMYHVLGTPPGGAPLPELWVSAAAFRTQISALAAAGYQSVTLAAVFAAWRHGAPLPAKPVVLTFDDGYRSDATVAAPVLRKLGWPGVLNLEVNNLGASGLPRHLAKRMIADGWEVASHTVTHPDLTTLGPAALMTELTKSRAEIRKRLGVDTPFFCYPAGRFDARVQAAVKAAGYRGATTVIGRVATRADDPYALPRLRITNADTPAALLARLRR